MKEFIDSISLIKSSSSNEIFEEFDKYVLPPLTEALKGSDLRLKVEVLSKAQHKLFLPFVKRVNTEDHFCKAFWKLANISIPIAQEFSQILDARIPITSDVTNSNTRIVLWLIKGAFELAHMDVVKNFMHGRQKFYSSHPNSEMHDQHFILFLDIPIPHELRDSKKVFSFASKKSTFLKIIRLREFVIQKRVNTIIWPSVFQNLSLYFGMRNSPQQIFWSAKHRIQILPETIDQYFFGGFSKYSSYYRGVPWKYGRFDNTPWKGLSRQQISSNNTKLANLSQKDSPFFDFRSKYKFLLGSICIEQKYVSQQFWDAINVILTEFPDAGYCFTGRVILPEVSAMICKLSCSSRIHYVGWLNDLPSTMKLMDLYIDAFPFGSSHVLSQAWSLNLPTISLLTDDNLRLSLFHSMLEIPKLKGKSQINFPGLCSTIDEYISTSLRCIADKKYASQISASQHKIYLEYMCNPVGMYEDFSSYIFENRR